MAVTPPVTLYCFAPAGAGGAGYRPWAAALAPGIVVEPVVLPGRESRAAEPFAEDLPALVRDVRDHLRSGEAAPYAFFGHSFGALVAYETALSLQRDGRRPPACVIVSGRRAPHLPTGRMQHRLSDGELTAELVRLGGTPPEMLAHLTPYLPVLRADLRLNETYRAAEGDGRLRSRLVAYAGRTDPLARPDALAAWRAYAGTSFAFRVFAGGHFFIQEQRAGLLAAVRLDLERGHSEILATAQNCAPDLPPTGLGS